MARRSDHTRDQLKTIILDAAWKIVGQDGFENLTARSIASNIGYTPGTIYNVFASMDDLYLHVNARTLDMLYDALSDAACNDPKKTPVRNMKKMAEIYMDFARKYRPYWLMLFSRHMPEDRKHEDWYREKIDCLFTPLENLLKPLFPANQGRKRKMATRVLWSSVHGLCFLQETGKIHIVGNKASTDMADYLIDTFISGVEKGQAPQHSSALPENNEK